MKIPLIPVLVIGTLVAVLWWWWMQPVNTYTKDIYYGGQTWQSVLIKQYRNDKEVATLPDGTTLTWSQPGQVTGEWILY